MDISEKKCHDCVHPMKPIRIIDNTARSVGKPFHGDLEYTVPDTKRSIWTGLLPVEGQINAWMCDSCGRVLCMGSPGNPLRVEARTPGGDAEFMVLRSIMLSRHYPCPRRRMAR
jgi:hypothetical protein